MKKQLTNVTTCFFLTALFNWKFCKTRLWHQKEEHFFFLPHLCFHFSHLLTLLCLPLTLSLSINSVNLLPAQLDGGVSLTAVKLSAEASSRISRDFHSDRFPNLTEGKRVKVGGISDTRCRPAALKQHSTTHQESNSVLLSVCWACETSDYDHAVNACANTTVLSASDLAIVFLWGHMAVTMLPQLIIPSTVG